MTVAPSGPGSQARAEEAVVSRLRAAGCVFAEEEAALLLGEATAPEALEAMVARRVAGEPLEHVLGWAELCGRRFAVEPGVFVPRRRTELLVRQARTVARAGGVLVDLCCGSGAIGAAVAAEVAGLEVHAVDFDPAAVRCARRNLAPFGGTVYEGDLAGPLPARLRGRVGVIVACPPYVPTEEIALMPPEARDHEPRVALDGGTDGLDLTRRLAELAPEWLAPGGHVLVESSGYQAPRAVEVFARHGLTARVEQDPDAGATVVVGAMGAAATRR